MLSSWEEVSAVGLALSEARIGFVVCQTAQGCIHSHPAGMSVNRSLIEHCTKGLRTELQFS